MMPVFVGSGAGVGRAGKREQRHDSKGSNLHDHLLQIQKGETIVAAFGSTGWRLPSARPAPYIRLSRARPLYFAALDGDLFHSDNEEFFSSLSAPYELQKVRTAAVKIAKFYDCQAEYEGSIPFTRSINAALPSFLAALLVAWPRVSRRVISFFTLATSIMHRGNFCSARGERHA